VTLARPLAASVLVFSGCAGHVSSDATVLDAPRAFEAELAELCGRTLLGDPLSKLLADDLLVGRVMFNADAAERCLSQLRRDACLEAGETLASLSFDGRTPGWCRQAYSGTIESGSACQFGTQCFGDAYCRPVTEESSICTLRDPPGTPCYSTDSCTAADSVIPSCTADAEGVTRCGTL
jgi:hypothetical protein